ncbi:hypothetical protein KP509_21G027100 [Ceratopteris richardii]|nr:hypothetical protein KP509_21G027100 [Ceratopteris richardii]
MWVRQEDNASSDLPSDFLEPLSPGTEAVSPFPLFPTSASKNDRHDINPEIRQFWKSGNFTSSGQHCSSFVTEGMDHVRVHPKFLHSNATSHKWVLGAIAELVDNAVDEIRNGATFVKVDVQKNPRNGEPMLVIEDDGGGMDPDSMRHCMSLGYSAKSKLSNTIGQYGNGFKTSTMRLGADVIVFSRHAGDKPSQSIGMVSYTFLTSTGLNDVVVPIIDFQIEAFGIRKLIRSNLEDWMESMETIEQWSPYSSQAELLSQFESMPRRQGTRVVIYNLWEDDEGHLELDFDANPRDIQTKSVTRDERNLKVAARYPSCRIFLTYKHSLRTYISFLYLRLPSKFHIYLRGKEVHHCSLRNDMMLVEQVTYRPKDAGRSKAVVTLGFVKDAKEHIDISGFNVYHKNRLIKPFWRLWNPSDTRGRGIIAILEANFVEPAHDKQGFERTVVLSRLEARLVEMQKKYWYTHCHKIGYNNTHLKGPAKSIAMNNNRPAIGSRSNLTANISSEMSSADAPIISSNEVRGEILLCDKTGATAHNSGIFNHISGVEAGHSQRMTILQERTENLLKMEIQSPSFVPACIDFPDTAIQNSKGVVFFKEGNMQDQPSCLYPTHSGENANVGIPQRDVQTINPPRPPNVTLGTHVPITSSIAQGIKAQGLCSPSSTTITPVVIDLDSPDAGNSPEIAHVGIPISESHDPQKIVTEEVCIESGISSQVVNEPENHLPANNMTGSPDRNCLEGMTITLTTSLPLGEVKSSISAVNFKNVPEVGQFGMPASESSETQKLSTREIQCESVILSGVASRLENFLSANNITDPREKNLHEETTDPSIVCLPSAVNQLNESRISKCGHLENFAEENRIEAEQRESNLKSCGQLNDAVSPPMQESLDASKTKNEGVKLVKLKEPGKQIPKDGFCSNVSEKNMMEMKTAYPATYARSPEAHGSGIPEFHDRRDNLTARKKVSTEAASQQTIKGVEALETPLISSNIAEDAIHENDSTALASAVEAQGRNNMIASTVMKGSTNNENVYVTLDRCRAVSQGTHEKFNNDQVAPGVEGSVLPDMDAVMVDAKGEGSESMRLQQGTMNDAKECASEPVDQSTDQALSQMQVDCTEQHDVTRSAQAPCQDIIIRPTMDTVDVADMCAILADEYNNLTEEDRLLLAQHQIESLQQNIEIMGGEVADLKEELRLYHQSEQLEFRKLNMELEAALSRLEELKG